jgi:hypothetical protein
MVASISMAAITSTPTIPARCAITSPAIRVAQRGSIPKGQDTIHQLGVWPLNASAGYDRQPVRSVRAGHDLHAGLRILGTDTLVSSAFVRVPDEAATVVGAALTALPLCGYGTRRV